jgi:hypothetical protein
MVMISERPFLKPLNCDSQLAGPAPDVQTGYRRSPKRAESLANGFRFLKLNLNSKVLAGSGDEGIDLVPLYFYFKPHPGLYAKN